MPKRQVQAYEMTPKYARAPSPTRDSLDSPDGYRLSTSSRASSLGEHDPLSNSPSPHRNRQYRDYSGSALPSLLGSEKYGSPRRRSLSRNLSRWLIPSRMCCCMVLLFFVSLSLLLTTGGFWAYKEGSNPPTGQSDPWYPAPRGGTDRSWKSAYDKAGKLVGQMTLVEKVNITTGTGWMMDMCVGNTGAVDRLKFPALCLQDGPLGLRFADRITASPAGLTVGATWNKDLMWQRGKDMAVEARLKGVNVILGPSMGPLGRLPAAGRNWEGFGADPVLQGIASARTIQGIQDEGVMATAKHYVGNEQEHYRQSWEWGTPNAISSNVDDRTMHEIYAWPFAESVRAGVASVMCSYNMLNNSYTCQNSKLLNGILKDELGFQGFVQSDWLAQRSGVASALAGLDMSMPGDGLIWQDGVPLWGTELTKAVLNGSVPVERLDDMALRIVAAWYQVGQDDKDKWHRGEKGGPNFSSWTDDEVGLLHPGSDDKTTGVVNKFVDAGLDHSYTARSVVAEGTVVVKNEENVLPFSKDGFEMTRSDRLKLKIGIFGEDAYTNPDGANSCPDRSCNKGTLAQAWGSGTVEFPYLISPSDALHQAFKPETVDIIDHPTNDAQSAASAAADRHLCLVFINSDGGEGYMSWEDVKGDRNDLYAQKGGDQLVKKVATSCGAGKGHVVVVYHAIGPVILEKWIDLPNVKAVVMAHLPGQESGSGLADILFGDINPSGRLPYSIAKREEDYGPTSGIMYKANNLIPQQNFSEGIYIDYRYLDAHEIEPRYEFGYGLSYTTFKITDMSIHALPVDRKLLPEHRHHGEDPPTVDRRIPSAADAVYPAGFRKLHKYVYPYIDSVSDIKSGHYPYPEGYAVTQPPSQAGGGQGGNPDLYSTMVVVQASLSNTGSRDGHCVVQLYIGFPANMTNSLGEPIDMPPRQLRAFEKLHVTPPNENGDGKIQMISMELTRKDLSFWDVGLQNWALPPGGEWTVSLGFSSRLIEAEGKIKLPSGKQNLISELLKGHGHGHGHNV